FGVLHLDLSQIDRTNSVVLDGDFVLFPGAVVGDGQRVAACVGGVFAIGKRPCFGRIHLWPLPCGVFSVYPNKISYTKRLSPLPSFSLPYGCHFLSQICADFSTELAALRRFSLEYSRLVSGFVTRAVPFPFSRAMRRPLESKF